MNRLEEIAMEKYGIEYNNLTRAQQEECEYEWWETTVVERNDFEY